MKEQGCPECNTIVGGRANFEAGKCVWCHGDGEPDTGGREVVDCSHCKGSGKCPTCRGSGYVTAEGQPSR
jgi:hypothetical protein